MCPSIFRHLRSAHEISDHLSASLCFRAGIVDRPVVITKNTDDEDLLNCVPWRWAPSPGKKGGDRPDQNLKFYSPASRRDVRGRRP